MSEAPEKTEKSFFLSGTNWAIFILLFLLVGDTWGLPVETLLGGVGIDSVPGDGSIERLLAYLAAGFGFYRNNVRSKPIKRISLPITITKKEKG